MLILVYGDDTFRAQEKVSELRGAFQKKFDPTGLNLATFGSDAKPGEVMQAVQSLPFISLKRMVIIRDLVATTKKDGEEAWAGLAKTPDSSIVVLWETMEPKALEKKALFQAIRKGEDVRSYPFPALEGSELSAWTADRVKARGGSSIAADALRELTDRVGSNLWQMDNEIGKLVALCSGRAVALADVDGLVRASFDGEIFALVDAVSRKEGKKAVRLLREERWSGASDFQIFAMLARQVRLLLGARALLDENPRASSQQLASEMNINPFVAQKVIEQARKFSLADLRATHDLLFSYDAGMKSGFLDAELAVDLVTTTLVR